MKNELEKTKRKCPRCEKEDGQMKNGRTLARTQTYLCRHCKKTYTLEPKNQAYNEEIRALALKIYYSVVSGVGKILGMSKGNVYNWIKKNSKESSD